MQRNPAHIGVAPPKPMHVPDLRYVYDAIQNGRVTVSHKFTDIGGTTVASTPACPEPWGATVQSAAGGDVIGYDYLGQRTKVTLGAGVPGNKALAWIESAPADAVWLSIFGLPYLAHGTPALDDISGSGVNLTAAAPGTGDERGLWEATTAVTGDWVEFSYAVNTTNLHGDAYIDIASAAIDSNDTSMVGTVDNTGAVAITTVAVTGAGTNLHFHFPDGGYVKAANGAGTVNYTIAPLWMQQYAKRSSAIDEDVLITWCGDDANIGGHVDLTGDVEPTSGASSVQVYGPFTAGGDETPFWTDSNCRVGFDIDSDVNPDVWYSNAQVQANENVTQLTKDAVQAQLDAQGC